MSIFDEYLLRDSNKSIRKTLKIYDSSYDKLEYLKLNYYPKVSINKLMTIAIEDFLQHQPEYLSLPRHDSARPSSDRGLRIRLKLDNELVKASEKYDVSVARLVNYIISKALESESEKLKGYDEATFEPPEAGSPQ